MLTFDQIKELVELVARHQLHGFELERSGFKLSIQGNAPAPAPDAFRGAPTTAAPPAAGGSVAPPQAAPAPAAAEAAPAGAGLHVLTSPIVGTFYAAPSPDATPFVRAGDRVRRGQVLCIVEAMKLMNEIESDVDGVVAEIFPKNAQPVEYGEPLFGIRPD